MLFYYLFPLLIFIFVIPNYRKEWAGVLVMALLLFFSMFRGDDVGTDTIHYLENSYVGANHWLNKSSIFDADGRYEFLYYLLCLCVEKYQLSPRYIIYLLSVCSIVFMYLGARRMKINLALMALFYILTNMYIFSFNVARQFAAIGIMFYGVSFIKDDTWKKYLFFLWILIAGLLHNSMWLCVFLYFCRYLNFNRKKAGYIAYAVFLICAFIPFNDITIDLLSKLNIARYSDKYGTGSDFASTESMSVIGVAYKIIIGTIYYLIYKLRNKSEQTDFYDNLFLVFMFITAILAYGNLATFRFKLTFEIFCCMFMALYFSKLNLTKNSLFMIYSVIRFILIFRVASEYNPYQLQF